MRFYLEDPSVLEHPAAVYMLQLMTAYDVLRSAQRWIKSTSPADSPAQSTEQLVAVLAAIAWTHEVKELLRKGWSSREKFIEKNYLDGDAELKAIWDELKSGNSDRLEQLRRIRTKYTFHFDEEGAKKAIDYIKKRGASEFPFFETDGSGRVGDSRYPLAYLVLGSSFFERDIDERTLAAQVDTIGSIMQDMQRILKKLLQGLWNKMDVKLVEKR